MNTVVSGRVVRRKEFQGEFGQHPLHPNAEFSTGAADAAGLLFKSHGLTLNRILCVHRLTLHTSTSQKYMTIKFILTAQFVDSRQHIHSNTQHTSITKATQVCVCQLMYVCVFDLCR